MPVSRHSDARRELVEWVQDGHVRACKVLTAKTDCVVGSHSHRKKHEWFYLASGEGKMTLDGETFQMVQNQTVLVRRGLVHSFELKKGAVLLGAASEPFDPKDDYSA